MGELKLIDIHTHIIPDVDDGSKSFDQSLLMLQMMIEQGVSDVIATPHVNSNATKATWERQVRQYNILKEKAKDLNINLHLGAELKYRKYLVVDYNKFKIENTKYILMEFSWEVKEDIHGILKMLKEEGFKPIIAHVERYSYLTIDDYKKFKENGYLLQVNTGSILNLERELWTNNANILIENKLADFIATDTHNIEYRKPNLKKAYEYLSLRLDYHYLTDLFYNNPLKIIKDIK